MFNFDYGFHADATSNRQTWQNERKEKRKRNKKIDQSKKKSKKFK